MKYEALKDFELHSKVPTEVIEKYKDKIPPELLEIWQEYGFGTFANGYMKIINPDEYMDVLERSYFASDYSIPLFATGLADIVTLQKGEYIGLVKYRRGEAPLHLYDFVDFIEDLEDPETIEFLDNEQYERAVQLHGSLAYDECFGYVPLLALGGSELPEKLCKVAIIPHIDLITELDGELTFA